MLIGKQQRVRARILVKAHPQPSQAYEETVCVAAVTEDGKQMLRLYPIRFRRLSKELQFERYDLVEMEVERPVGDPRPESRHVNEGSIRIVERGSHLEPAQKVALWAGHVVPSLTHLVDQQKKDGRSFGIVRPDLGSVKFFAKPIETASDEDRVLANQLFEQQALFESPLIKLQPPTYSFGYSFTSGGHSHRLSLLDWEVQATWFHYQKRYGSQALEKMHEMYSQIIPTRNLHFILGNQHKRPWQFILIGLLRSPLDPVELGRQGALAF